MDESIDDFARLIERNLFTAETEHVGVIMLASHRGGLFITNERGTNSGDFIGSDAHADTRSTNKNAKIVLMLRHGMSHCQRVVRIIAGFPRVAPKVADRMTLFLKVKPDRFLQLK